MNGIINILKPAGMTSFDVVSWLRRLTKIKKIGHTGTLDPMACGVLPVCIGNATKAIEYLVDKDKVYRAELTLGSATDTQDSYGAVLSTCPVNVSDDELVSAAEKFRGRIVQIPPMYSAVKVGGKKLYELARQGITIERAEREVEIFSLEILNIDRQETVKILFDVHCSKGTYIRTLCADMGGSLGCGGHMSFLLRKRSGIFEIEDSLTMEEAEAMAAEGRLAEQLVPVDKALETMGGIVLDSLRTKKLLNGIAVEVEGAAILEGGNQEGADIGRLVRVYDENGKFLAVGETKMRNNSFTLKSVKLFL